MSFIQILKNIKTDTTIKKSHIERIFEKKGSEKPEDILRMSGYRIKLITPTSFGTQITFAKGYVMEDIEKLLKNFNVKFKGDRDIFIIT